MISGVTVGEAEVKLAGVADAGHQLLLLALMLVARVVEDLALVAGGAVVLYVLGHRQVRHRTPAHRHGLAAQRTHRNLEYEIVSND